VRQYATDKILPVAQGHAPQVAQTGAPLVSVFLVLKG
jgi:hypothetical protein